MLANVLLRSREVDQADENREEPNGLADGGIRLARCCGIEPALKRDRRAEFAALTVELVGKPVASVGV